MFLTNKQNGQRAHKQIICISKENNLRKIKGKTRKIGHSIGLTSGLFSMSKQIVSNDHHACRFFLSSANSWLGLDFFPSKGGKCMGYYSFDWRSLLSPRTSIGFHKRLKITRGRNKSRDQRPRLGTKVCKHQNGI